MFFGLQAGDKMSQTTAVSEQNKRDRATPHSVFWLNASTEQKMTVSWASDAAAVAQSPFVCKQLVLGVTNKLVDPLCKGAAYKTCNSSN